MDDADKIWANSGDSHAMEPDDLWQRELPRALADRGPRVSRDERMETVHIDDQVAFRTLASFADAGSSAPGARDPKQRLIDLDHEGVWGQLMFPSRGLWITLATDPELYRECARVYNDWLLSEVMSVSPRLVGVAMLSALSTGDAVTELRRVAALGYQAVMVACTAPEGRSYNDEVWDPLWAAAEDAGVVVSFHVGTGASPKAIKGPGAVVSNYVETFIPGQRVVTHLVASGALERHPALRVLIAEGGASWVPALADRMDEGWRQHGSFATPKLTKLPSETIFGQVYASFQHDRSAVPAFAAMGYRNVMWGDDYPHMEGTYGHTQKTLHELFDPVPVETRRAITEDTFRRLFTVPDRTND
jgi:predicted TIM-barrel fold metal-dependent hydrolase